MRKLYVSAALAALALCALPSCVKEVLVEDNPAPGKEEQTWTVSAEATKAEKDPESKALLLSDDGSEIDFYWAGTDQVEVYDADGNLRGTLVPDPIGTSATQLTGTLSGSMTYDDTFTLYYLKNRPKRMPTPPRKGRWRIFPGTSTMPPPL